MGTVSMNSLNTKSPLAKPKMTGSALTGAEQPCLELLSFGCEVVPGLRVSPH